jgi:hypothetical protein
LLRATHARRSCAVLPPTSAPDPRVLVRRQRDRSGRRGHHTRDRRTWPARSARGHDPWCRRGRTIPDRCRGTTRDRASGSWRWRGRRSWQVRTKTGSWARGVIEVTRRLTRKFVTTFAICGLTVMLRAGGVKVTPTVRHELRAGKVTDSES